MAKLSNINGKFAVEDTGAIRFSDQTGTTGQILKSNGNSAPTWVDPNTVGTGPWLPLAGGIVSGATTFQSSLTIGGTAVFNGDMTLPAAADHFLIGAGSLQTTGRIKFGLPSWNNSIGLESYWMVMRSNSNEGYKFIDSGGNTYVQFNAGTNSSGANYSYFKGRIGIGTDSPNQKLVVQADWNGSLSNNQQLQIQGDTDTTLQLRLGYDTTNDYAEIAALKSGTGYKNIILNRGGANIGIGTASTEGKLTISYTAAELPTSGTTSNSAIQVISSLNNQLNLGLNTVSGDYGAYIQASDNNLAVPYPLNLQPNGGLAYFGGQVAIGDSTPNSGGKLDVVGGLISNGYNSNGRSTFDGSTNSDLTITVNQSQANVQPRIWFNGSNSGATPTTYARMDVDGFYPPNGIFLGGTAAANKLANYEIGDWTPVIAHNDGTGVVPLNVASARYVRVGELVYVSAYLTAINPNGNAGGSGAYYGIRGMPFNPENYGAWQIVYASSGITAYGGYSSVASLYFMANGTNGQRSQAHVSGAGVNAWGSNVILMMNCVYNING